MAEYYALKPLKSIKDVEKPDIEIARIPDAAWATTQTAAVPIVDLSRWGYCIWHCQGNKPALDTQTWDKDAEPPIEVLRTLWQAIKTSHEFAK